MEPISGLSLLAVLAYLGTVALALAAAGLASGRRGRAAALRWVLAGVAFAALAGWRYTNGEALLQDSVRTWTRIKGVYDDRYTFQIPLTLAAILVVAALLWLALRWRGNGRSGQALCLALIMLIFTAVRATSLHAVDAFLYESIGPVHINYLIDLGLTAGVAVLALLDCRSSIMGDKRPPVDARRSRHARRTRHRRD